MTYGIISKDIGNFDENNFRMFCYSSKGNFISQKKTLSNQALATIIVGIHASRRALPPRINMYQAS